MMQCAVPEREELAGPSRRGVGAGDKGDIGDKGDAGAPGVLGTKGDKGAHLCLVASYDIESKG